jgi:hypothetical protein
LRPAWADSSWDTMFTIAKAKWPGGVAQAGEHLCEREALSSNPTPTKKNSKEKISPALSMICADFLLVIFPYTVQSEDFLLIVDIVVEMSGGKCPWTSVSSEVVEPANPGVKGQQLVSLRGASARGSMVLWSPGLRLSSRPTATCLHLDLFQMVSTCIC